MTPSMSRGVAPGTRLMPGNAPGMARNPGTLPRSTAGSNHWTGNGNWNGNWRHHHHHHSSIIFIGGFGFPFGYPYPYWYYPYDYYPYGSYYYGRPADYEAVGAYDTSLTVQVQRRLVRAGYYHGSIDGIMGRATQRAIRAYERTHNLRVDGVISEQLIATMGLG